jgi:hypothetical protein
VSPAIFWQKDTTKPLASHLIASAGKLNTAAISGLEILLCDASGFHRLSDASISELESKANEWDRNIGDLFLSINSSSPMLQTCLTNSGASSSSGAIFIPS